MRVAVIGAGSWGTALASVLADKGDQVTLWSYEPECAESINAQNENQLFLPGITLPPNLRATTDLGAACEGAQLVVSVTPSHVTRAVFEQLVEHLPEHTPIVSATKGIENETLMTISELLEDVLPLRFHPYLAYLSGPSFAREVAQRHPTTVAVASYSDKLGQLVQNAFHTPYFRAYRTTDVEGVEIGGSLKNVIAIAVGVADGMGFGHNSRAALITRGLAEISRLAVKRGANPLTVAGLAGMGDLVLTCTGGLSRNRAVGVKLGQGRPIAEILGDMRMVAEGVKTAKSVYDLAESLGVDMPICREVYRVLYEGKTPAEGLKDLMARELTRENFGF